LHRWSDRVAADAVRSGPDSVSSEAQVSKDDQAANAESADNVS
jgi:hypothetical protein